LLVGFLLTGVMVLTGFSRTVTLELGWVMRKIVRNVLIGLSLILVVAVISIAIYVQPLQAKDSAKAALSSTASVTITDSSDQIVFMPAKTPKTGLIFYPGAKVDPVAYSESLRTIAEAGYAVFLEKFPLNFAIIQPNRADDVIAKNPSITNWAIAGHSLGGASACLYAKNSSKVKALIFWAAYCDKSFDLSSRTDVQVTSISGSLDALATPEKVESTKVFAPSSAKYVVINGGNHAQFGNYGVQSGDNPATISLEDQQKQVVAATVAALNGL
jgi:Alpha/beta hydrolase family